VHQVIKHDLKLVCLRKKKAQDLTATNRIARLNRAKQLLRKYPEYRVPFIWFLDETNYTVASRTRKKEVPAERLLKTRSNFSRSVMVSVSVTVSNLGCTELVFVEAGVKVNGP